MRPFDVSVYWRYLTWSQKTPFNLKVSQNFLWSKINLNQIAGIVLTLEMNFLQIG
jgi:hypothetical protein